MKNFLVYKSSAGSGKTTTLVKEYLKLTLKNPSLFRKILAITFTNKAANEMKSRIVETLQKIIAGETEKDSVVAETVRQAGLSPQQAVSKAKELLFNIEHHYEEFSVSTIDSFVHKIVRTFAADLGLPQNFEVIIDKDDFVPFIVEDIYKKVGRDAGFTRILTEFVLSKVEDEKSHNINDTLSDFVEELLEEHNFFASTAMEETGTADFIKITKNIWEKKTELKKLIVSKAREAFAVIQNAGLGANDFSGKSRNGAISFFTKAQRLKIEEITAAGITSTIQNVFYNDTGWYTKSASGDVVAKIENIKDVLKDYFNKITQLAQEYLFYTLIFNNIYQVALTHEIRELIRFFIERTQKVHISEFNKHIAKKIAGEPVPFIYERLGVRYSHFMIDEFQDTSVLQWNNLLPLVHESLSGGNFNMVAGDAKQAIYRFRGGEVELFTHLPKLYGIEKNTNHLIAEKILTENYREEPLEWNFRSRKDIIGFNNDFFEQVKSGLSEDLRKIYEGHKQKVPPKAGDGGFISLRLLSAESAAEYREKTEQEILEIIKDLNDRGYPFGDIAVLSKKNKDSSSIASLLLQNGVPVVSGESIKLSASMRVRFLASLLRYLIRPGDEINNAGLIHLFLELKNNGAGLNRFLLQKKTPREIMELFGYRLPDRKSPLLSQVYEMTEELLRLFFKEEPPDLFIRFFLDFIYDSRAVHMGDIGLLLELWEEKRDKLSISLPEGTNAVQLMTAHKAKGLKFGAVIVDLEYYKPGKNRDKIWLPVDDETLKPLNKTLFDLTGKLKYIGKGDIYEKEEEKKRLDFLNLIYVAFTRPVDALFAIGKADGNFGNYLAKYLQSKDLLEENRERYDFGKWPEIKKEEKKSTAGEVSVQHPEHEAWDKVLTIAGPGKNPFLEKELPEQDYGNLFHELMASIRVASDLEPAISSFGNLLKVPDDVMKKLKNQAEELINHPELKHLFQNRQNILTETEIYDPETGKLLRADRVIADGKNLTVIDYKTGDKEAVHQKQIRHYGQLFEKAGYNVQKMLLVYVHEKIDTVEVA